ncbi:hypothetical protein L202_04816 [Cryptococcus amylolentus CBS 6039]|uniref:Sfi1 spindle body domain-containing protein n=1 Tax=Cryptococcus amylolentus CBS 6039 TaxID=1295533 RepID=A0A1E3HNE9_9TREE|nr:hypothetical protein L202_04816 [Cryptococcus amylolentus CBS 6039]ODN77665.1 hypothetical protein L202_04816 [Cryptococcus amylolentus CBS 6039]
MFPPLSSSSRSTDTAALSASVDLEVIEAIFERGRDATSFPQIFRPYTEVLQESGISPTNDSVYYNFLLKVGVIKAPTWGDKWDVWKAAHSQTLPSFYSQQASGSYSSGTYTQPNKSYASSQLPEVRKRVPFLASASSDLDEGYTGGEESEVLASRPSPRKSMLQMEMDMERDKSSGRYTPTQVDMTVEEDLISFDPPIRTSTPIYAQHQHYSRGPPAYTASDISRALEDTADGFSALGLSTPKQRQREMDAPQTISWVDQIDELSIESRRQMEEKADVFYNYGLLWRCWNMWFKTSEWYRFTYKNITTARNNLLLRQALEKWQHRTRNTLSLPPVADHHYSTTLKKGIFKLWLLRIKQRNLVERETQLVATVEERARKRVWHKWEMRWKKRREDRWRTEMAEKEIGFAQKMRKARLASVFAKWCLASKYNIVHRRHQKYLLANTLTHWRDATLNQRHLNGILGDVQLGQKEEAFHIWRQATVLRPLERELVLRNEQRLVGRVMDEWRMSSWQNRQASKLDRRRLLGEALSKWKQVHLKQKGLNRKAQTFSKLRILATTLHTWRLSSREILFEQIKDRRRVTRAFAAWKAGQDRLKGLEALADTFIEGKDKQLVTTALKTWRSKASHLAHLDSLATHFHHGSLKTKCLAKWRSATQTISTNKALADQARGFFVKRSVFGVWKGQWRQTKVDDWVRKREERVMRGVTKRWRGMARKYQDLEKRDVIFTKFVDQRTQQASFTKWLNRVIEVKDRELRAARDHDEKLCRDVVATWCERLSRIRADEKRADDAVEIRENEHLRRTFQSWRLVAKRSKRLRLASEQSLIEKDGRLLRNVWEKWWEKKRERDLEGVRREVEFLHENVILFGVMDKWKAATVILPGIQADATRVKNTTWNAWREAFEVKTKSKRLQKERDTRLLYEAFNLWKDSATEKALLKARRARNRSRPSGGHASDPKIGPRRSLPPSSAHHRSGSASTAHRPSLNPPPIPTGRTFQEYDRPTSEYSEPVYTRLRDELGLKRNRRVGSEEPVVPPVQEGRKGTSNRFARGGSVEVAPVPIVEPMERPRSGSEMLRALRGSIPER